MSESAGANSGAPFQTIPEYAQPSPKVANGRLSKRSKSLNRKTSAEIVQEAKNMLANTTPAHSIRSYSSMMSSASTLKFEGTFKGSGKIYIYLKPHPVTPYYSVLVLSHSSWENIDRAN